MLAAIMSGNSMHEALSGNYFCGGSKELYIIMASFNIFKKSLHLPFKLVEYCAP